MKKLIFTALAAVAFSGVAMANSTEVKYVIAMQTKAKEIKILQATPCEDAAIDTYELIISNRYDQEDDIGLLNDLIGLCH